MVVNFYLGYLNKLLDEYNHSYHSYIGKKPIHLVILRCLKKFSQIIKVLNLKLVIE